MPDVPEQAVRAVFATVARARGARALHPRGRVTTGRVHRSGLGAAPIGVPWIDEPGQDRVLVRFSRAAGLPPPLPDGLGLAVRILPGAAGGEPADLLLTTTGSAPGLRHVIRPRFAPARATYTSIVPFRTAAGRTMVGAFPDGDGFSLRVAGLTGGWREFGLLELGHPADEPPDLDTDPVLHPIDGLALPSWLAGPRAQAYDASRRARRSARAGGR
jgi:hypothetical protein